LRAFDTASWQKVLTPRLHRPRGPKTKITYWWLAKWDAFELIDVPDDLTDH